MAMGWTEALSVGVEEIDEQHKIWFQKADELFEAGKKGKTREIIGSMLNFLDEYTKKHFHDEEMYMLKIHYPEYSVQKRLHTEFVGQLAKLKREYGESGGNIAVIINANQLVINWLVNHITKQDKRIGEYARSLKK